MKLTKFVFIILCFSLVFSCISATASDYEENLRVGIYYGSGVVNSLTIESSDEFSVGYYKEREFFHVSTLPSGKYTAKSSASAFYVNYGEFSDFDSAKAKYDELNSNNITCSFAFYGSSICVLGEKYENLNNAEWVAQNLSLQGTPVQLSATAIHLIDTSKNTPAFVFDSKNFSFGIYSDQTLDISGAAGGLYRGGFEITYRDGGLTVVNVLPAEDYLYSVVSREMSPSWNIEALKAQAVCARNFALGRKNYHSKYGFDVCRTVCCQAYAGTSSENENVHNAVNQTRGELLLYDGKPIQAVYSSSMGETTESVENVWGTPFPYLVSVENPYEDTENIYNGKWTKTLTKSRASEIMENRGYNIGEVTDIIALEYTPAGRVLKLEVKGTSGSKIFEREACRSIFSEVTYSQKYTVSKGGIITYPTVYVSNGGSANQKNISTVSVISSNGSISSIDDCFVTNGKQTKQYSPSSSGGDPNTFTFVGEGWGHGVGMSQYGAKGMADAGFTYDEILIHYYKGTYLEKAY